MQIYTKFSEKFKDDIQGLELEIQNPEISSSNLQKAIDKAIMMSSKLHEYGYTEIWIKNVNYKT